MNVGTTAYATAQGIAHLAWDFWRHGLIQRVWKVSHPHYWADPRRYPSEVCNWSRESFLDGLDALLLFETGLDWPLVQEASRRGIKIAVVPMYEYTPHPFPVKVDLWLCPSLLDVEYCCPHHQRGMPLEPFAPLPAAEGGIAVHAPIPVDTQRWPWRLRERALRFIHNAGHAQWQYGKGTPELLEAMKLVKSPVQLLLRGQPEDAKVAHLFKAHRGDRNVTIQEGTLPAEQLYDGDVFVYPERYNGLSLPLQEAHASGLLVMTTNRFPANAWLPNIPLIPVSGYQRCVIAREFERAIIDPREIATAIDTWHGKDISQQSIAGREWAERHSWERLLSRYREVLGNL